MEGSVMVSKLGLKAIIVLGVIAATVVFDPSDAQAFFRRRRAYSSGNYNTSYSSDCGCNSGGGMSSTQYQGSTQYAERAGSAQYPERAGSTQYSERAGGDYGYRDNLNRESDRGSREGYEARRDEPRPPAPREESERIKSETRSSDSKGFSNRSSDQVPPEPSR
jgi:hypothetical protein